MNALDLFFKKFSYKFPKGYPDMNNTQDVLLLESLLGKVLGEENTIKIPILEVTDSYDARIKSVLGTDTIPKCKTPLKVGENFNLNGDDGKIWKELYPIKPLKADSQTPTAGSGNGEIATYWAYQHNVRPIETVDGRSGEDPDLIIGGFGVEVKSYDTKTITLGKFAGDKETINLLNKVFGTLSLFTEESIQANTGNFNTQSLLSGFKLISELHSNEELKKLPVTKPFFDKIDILYNKLGVEKNATAEQATVALLRKLLWTKLSKKPNRGQEVGYILNVNPTGTGVYYKITQELINNIPDEKILDNGVTVKSSEIQMNFNKLFG
jgi:hypothetical protein